MADSPDGNRRIGQRPAPATVPGRQMLIFTDETARRRADDAVMTGIVAGATAYDRALPTTVG